MNIVSSDLKMHKEHAIALTSKCFEHEERSLPNCVLSPDEPLYAEWTQLDKMLDAVGKKEKSAVLNELLPCTSTFQPEEPWIIGAFKLPFVYGRTCRGSKLRWREFMELANADKRFQRYVVEDERSSYPSSNAVHCEQHIVSRALFVASNQLRRAVSFSNLDQMRDIRNGMRGLLDALDILMDGETRFRRSVAHDLEAGDLKHEED